MAESGMEQYATVYTLGVQPGIKRDGTIFEAREFSAGEWCRFQRGTPRKMGGYRQMFATLSGIPRGMVANAYDGLNYIFVGNEQGIDVFTTNINFGVGTGPFFANFTNGYSQFPITVTSSNTFTITSTEDLTSVFGNGTEIIFSQITQTPFTVTSSSFTSPTTTVTISGTIPGGSTNVWLYNYAFEPDSRLLWQFDLQYSPVGEQLKVLAHPGLNLNNIDNGVPSQVLVGDILPTSPGVWEFTGLADTSGQNPTYRAIAVDGGVCVLYPYIFVYGSNGYIANNHVEAVYGQQTLTDWNGPTANQVNMSSSKIVKGVPMRGGTNSPSGLFWATDSLIRVSFTGQAPLYWRYDIISSQISIMSSSSVVEMDGLFYWMGVDRFYVYNGQVNVLPNDKNVNWLFDNINFEQRQKVWATKVPRFNEIWFFYPRGTSTECNDAIIYNVKDKIWYDAGSAIGAQRSCGYTTEIFPTPIWASWGYDLQYSAPYYLALTPAEQPEPNSNQFYVTGNVTTEFSPGATVTFNNTTGLPVYYVDTSLYITATGPEDLGATLVTLTAVIDPAVEPGDTAYLVTGGYGLWQHEFGKNAVSLTNETPISSSITTCDISWVGGNPSQDSAQGANRRMHLRRVEPDFVQSGNMQLTILGSKFARGPIETAGPFTFGPNDGKIDLRTEFREVRLQFSSNTLGGDFQMGRVLITAEYGDERP